PFDIFQLAVSVYAANEGFLSDVPVNKVLAFEAALHAFFNAEYKALVDKINATADWNGEIEGQFKAGIEKFKATQSW
ncbi:MAG TPA: F0F1 ATP synthase subunit alpha, partial [Moraxellaceae bacterium]